MAAEPLLIIDELKIVIVVISRDDPHVNSLLMFVVLQVHGLIANSCFPINFQTVRRVFDCDRYWIVLVWQKHKLKVVARVAKFFHAGFIKL